MITHFFKLAVFLVALAAANSAVAPAMDQYPERGCSSGDGIVLSCGGWKVIQRRLGSEDYEKRDFELSWESYKYGFGDPDGDYWIGLETIREMTKDTRCELRIDFRDAEGTGLTYFATYDNFKISDEEDGYKLISLGNYNGDAGDALSASLNNKFSTHDVDNDDWGAFDCAEHHRGGWWFGYGSGMVGTYPFCEKSEASCAMFTAGGDPWDCARCALTNLNGVYYPEDYGTGIFWVNLPGYDCFLEDVEMRVRPFRG